MLTALSILVAVFCGLASVWRLRWAVAPTALDPAIVRQALVGEGAWPKMIRLRDEMASERGLAWEHDLLTAFSQRRGPVRDACVNEQLTELDGRADLWVRVPRVCASIASSAGFLFASIWLLGAVGTAVDTEAIMSTLAPALNALAVGIAGASFCGAVHVRARGARRRAVGEMDRLIEGLQALAARGDVAERSAWGR